MSFHLAARLGTIGVLILLLLIPVAMIDGLISERQALRDQVLADIARSSSSAQRLSGPILVAPYRKTVREWVMRPDTREHVQEEREVSGRLYFLPDRFALDGSLQTEERARGIHQARLFHLDGRISGHFQVPAKWGVAEEWQDYQFDTPFLALGISDVRGIGNGLSLTMNDQEIAFQPGSQIREIGDGVHATLDDFIADAGSRLEFDFTLALLGTGRLDFTPVGRETRIDISADWPHPSFVGNYLPIEREVSEDGFRARWQTSFFSTNMQEAALDCLSQSRCEAFNQRQFGVSLIDPVDHYRQSERTIKYAMLFIGLTFAAFFVFGILRDIEIHPMEYGLVGLALAIFYLLLLSLSEHLGFGPAYAIAAAACVALTGFYLCYVLNGLLRGLGFTAALALLYNVLFVIVSAEDVALLMGSVLLFALLAAVMVLTRNLDWQNVGGQRGRQQTTG